MKIKLFFFIICFLSSTEFNICYAKEIWSVDKDLSSIKFDLPVSLLKNVKGKFNNIEGFIEIDQNNKINNKALFSVHIDSIEINYEKYRDLLLSNVFFDSNNFPIAIADTNKFEYNNNSKLDIFIELTIKNITRKIPVIIEINHLAEELIQVKSKFSFNRTDYNIGIEKWSSTSILKNKITIRTDLFLYKN